MVRNLSEFVQAKHCESRIRNASQQIKDKSQIVIDTNFSHMEACNLNKIDIKHYRDLKDD
jgi:hypothetical protein